MASNSFGTCFRITTFGESHGPAIGVVIDGCPAGLPLTEADFINSMHERRPGRNAYTSARQEADQVEILSGLFEGKTTGTPIALLIRNHDANSEAYAPLKELYRPGHASFAYIKKYGTFDYRGGGRASARETVARVAAGVVAKKWLAQFSIRCVAFLSEMGGIPIAPQDSDDLEALRHKTYANVLFCPDHATAVQMQQKLRRVQEEGDSLGGILSGIAHIPSGLGDPIYAKLQAKLAAAMLSIPGAKGFEIGCGFEAARMRGSEHNDTFERREDGVIQPKTNRAGGTLGGVSTGQPLCFRVAFKPTSTLGKAQTTVTLSGEPITFSPPHPERHDPCLAIRAVPVVEAMTALVLADALLMSQLAHTIPQQPEAWVSDKKAP